MVKVGRRFFFNQTFQKKQRRVTTITIIAVIVAIIVTFSITSYFHDNSSEKGKIKYKLKQEYDVEIFTIMPSFLNYFEEIENVPLSALSIKYDDNFTYDENADSCTEEQYELIKKIRLGEEKAEDYDDPFACLNFVPNKLGSYTVTIKINKEETNMKLNIVDTTPPTFTSTDVTISNEETYGPENFITSCDDNSKAECVAAFYIPLRGEVVDYSKFKEPGTYDIKVVAKDQSGNAAEPQDVKLTISKVNYYKIVFNANGGSSVEEQTIREGEKIYSPYSQRDGYTLDGWYQGNKKYDFDKPVTSDLTLTAKWTKISSGGGYSGGGYSGGGSSGGSSSGSGGCAYGKYSDYTREVSMYASLLHGKGVNDCAEKNSSEDYAQLRAYALDVAYDLTERDKGAIDLDAQQMVGNSATINHAVKTKQIVNDKGGLSGVLVEIKSTSGSWSYTYTLYDCTLSSCRWR